MGPSALSLHILPVTAWALPHTVSSQAYRLAVSHCKLLPSMWVSGKILEGSNRMWGNYCGNGIALWTRIDLISQNGCLRYLEILTLNCPMEGLSKQFSSGYGRAINVGLIHLTNYLIFFKENYDFWRKCFTQSRVQMWNNRRIRVSW